MAPYDPIKKIMQKDNAKAGKISIFSSLDESSRVDSISSRIESRRVENMSNSTRVGLKMWATRPDLDSSSKCQLETRLDDQSISDQYLKYSFNLMFQICVDFSWDIFIKALKSLEFLWAYYASLSFDSTNMILISVALIVVMLNNIIETRNSLLSLHVLSSLNSLNMIKLSTA